MVDIAYIKRTDNLLIFFHRYQNSIERTSFTASIRSLIGVISKAEYYVKELENR